MRPVTVAQISEGQALIDSGLKANETVVVDGQYRLQPGQPRAGAARQGRAGGRPAERGRAGDPMNISAPFIRRPIATILLMVGLLLCGLATYRLLPVAALPNVNYPTIQITAQLPGADPQTMASSVATPLEQQLSQIPGRHAAHLDERAGRHLGHRPIRAQPHRRQRRGRRPGGDQRGKPLSAAEHPVSADDPEGESGRHAGPASRAHLRHACR